MSDFIYYTINNILIWLKLVRQSDYSALYKQNERALKFNTQLKEIIEQRNTTIFDQQNKLDEQLSYIEYIKNTNNIYKELDKEANKYLEYLPMPVPNILMDTFGENQTSNIAVQFNQTKCYRVPKHEFVDKKLQPYLFKAVAYELSQKYATELSALIMKSLENYNE